MENVYATLFEKVFLDKEEGICLFKPITVINGKFDYTTEILITEDGKKYFSSNHLNQESYVFGYVLTNQQLKDNFKEYQEEDYLKEYWKGINSNLYFGKNNLEEKIVDMIEIPKKQLLDICFEQEAEKYRYEPYLNERGIDFLINELEQNNLDKSITLLKGIKSAKNLLNLSLPEPSKIVKKEDKKIEFDLKELNDLIGLETVKEKVFELSNYLVFMNKVKNVAKLDYPNLHMVFTGNPGTGKTTVARIIAKLLYKMGYVKNNQFKEVTSKDLISGYIGQSATKTAELIEENKGGIIFIDEAYSLATVSSNHNFSQDALAEILKAMENKDAVFIFAGYQEEMKSFLEMNSGLNSRIGYFLEYSDYSLEQLIKMLKQKIEASGLQATNTFYTNISFIIEQAKKNKNFGNGRFIDKLFHQILLKHAANTEKVQDINSLLMINENDIPDDILSNLSYNNEKRLGFQISK